MDGPSPDDLADYARTLPDDEPSNLTFPKEWAQKAASKWKAYAVVSSDMSVTAKWKVVALGELQQPGGVGATQEDYNPVVDGPNPNGPEIDNAQNSPEQEIAMQTWVNTAVDMLNRGEQPEVIIAKLAHDGCPNPEQILQRAQQQPMEQPHPVSDSIGQDPFQAPPPADQTGEMQSLSQQPPTLARVRIAGTTMTGRELDRWEGMWGEGTVKIALDDGGTINVDPSVVEPIEGETFKHPVTEIQNFIDAMPPVEPSRPYIEARLANLELVRRAVRANISKVAFSDQIRLETMDRETEEESALLKEALVNTVEGHELEYFSHLPTYQINAFDVATPEIKEWVGRPREAGAIWASENFTAMVDAESFVVAAAHHASALGLTGTQFQEFLAGAEVGQTDHCPNCGASVTAHTGTYCHACGKTLTKKSATAAEDHEGPVEALFLR